MVSSMPTSAADPMATAGACLDPVEMESYIDYEQLRSTSPSRSPLATANPNNTLLRPAAPSSSAVVNQPLSFAGPSHQYDHYKQQTGLPPGALANTLAVNQALNWGAYPSAFDLAVGDDVLGSRLADELVITAPTSSHRVSFDATSDIGRQAASPAPDGLHAMLFRDDSVASMDCIDPSALDVPEPSPDRLPTSPSPRPQGHSGGRPWPGMHQQQAALAKARQQQQQQQQPPPTQPSLSVTAPPLPQPTVQGPTSITAAHPGNQFADDRISYLLDSMRHASVAGSSEDGTSPTGDGLHHHSGRMRKDEDDMDEDERLLASEAGKKLSSKERRQLRNKVSARAFRSRRKEYIGQLEAELAIKAKETNDVRQENRALREENTRLSDLTRMLLSSPAFSTFLDQLSHDAASTSSMAPSTQDQQGPPSSLIARPSTHEPAFPRKDVNPQTISGTPMHVPSQETPIVGMTLVPDPPIDFSAVDLAGGNGWPLTNSVNGPWGGLQPQVFSVHGIPDGPAVDHIDPRALSGKAPSAPNVWAAATEPKEEGPNVSVMPIIHPKVAADAEVVHGNDIFHPVHEPSDESNPAFALFSDAPSMTAGTVEEAPIAGSASTTVDPKRRLPRFGLAVDAASNRIESSAADSRPVYFDRPTHTAEAAFQRISRLTSHL